MSITYFTLYQPINWNSDHLRPFNVKKPKQNKLFSLLLRKLFLLFSFSKWFCQCNKSNWENSVWRFPERTLNSPSILKNVFFYMSNLTFFSHTNILAECWWMFIIQFWDIWSKQTTNGINNHYWTDTLCYHISASWPSKRPHALHFRQVLKIN